MMKTLSYLFMLILLTTSCTHDEIEVNPENLVGEWRTENTYINGEPASNFLSGGNLLYPSILGFKIEDFYFRDYNSGSWTIDENVVTLTNWGTFKITSYTDSLFTWEGEILAGQIYWDLIGIEEDEMITLREDCRRH